MVLQKASQESGYRLVQRLVYKRGVQDTLRRPGYINKNITATDPYILSILTLKTLISTTNLQ